MAASVAAAVCSKCSCKLMSRCVQRNNIILHKWTTKFSTRPARTDDGLHLRRIATIGGAVIVTAVISYEILYNRRYVLLRKSSSKGMVLAKESAAKKMPFHRESRFMNFASIIYDGIIYMSPLDFLESITEGNPRPRSQRRRLRQHEVEKFLKNTPSKKKSSSMFFRNLIDQGLISYTEYLFLLCVLTKPRSGFRIAFNMFDTDGDQRVDKKEFLVLEQLMANNAIEGLSNKDGGREGESLITDTTLAVHFFGSKGRDVLTYEDFHKFMDNLQTEILDLEFLEFSHGMATIKEEEFARILLRYTILTKEQHEHYLERLRKRISHDQGITFDDFKEFCQFLNNLDDFILAMRIYTYAHHPISEAEFKRAVKACTGQTLKSHLVHVVFQLFDEDGDGKLSYKEFISVMRERLHRGAKAIHQTHLHNFKACIKNEMRNSS